MQLGFVCSPVAHYHAVMSGRLRFSFFAASGGADEGDSGPDSSTKFENLNLNFQRVFSLHNDIFKFSNFKNCFFERRIPQRTCQVPWVYSRPA